MKRKLKVNKSVLLFLSGFFGEEILRVLSKTKCRPFVVVYPAGAQRRRAEFDFSKFSDIFQIFTVTGDNFARLADNNPLPTCDYALCVDWTKDFFYGSVHLPFKIYHAHPSLLPLYRGYGALSEQFLRGVCISGLSVYEDNGVIDGGDIVFQEKIKITLEDTPESFLKTCAQLLAGFIERLEKAEEFSATPQNAFKSFYVTRTRNNQKAVDFNASAFSVHNFIRAYSFPYPGARFYYKGEEYKALASSVESWSGFQAEAGEVLRAKSDGLEVACGDGSVVIRKISFNGKTVDIENYGFAKGDLLF